MSTAACNAATSTLGSHPKCAYKFTNHSDFELNKNMIEMLKSTHYRSSVALQMHWYIHSQSIRHPFKNTPITGQCSYTAHNFTTTLQTMVAP